MSDVISAQPKTRRQRVATETLVALYSQHGTLDKVASIVGLNRASVHERLKKAGYAPKQNAPISDDERRQIQNYYGTTPKEQFSLSELATRLGRTKALISRTARELGLTDRKRPASAATRENMRSAFAGKWNSTPHPRGMLGKRHSEKTKQSIAADSRLRWVTDKTFGIGLMDEAARQSRSDRATARMAHGKNENAYSRAKRGRRADLGDVFFRSAWEANYARYLNLLIKMKVVERWEYEPETFWFEAIKRGVRSYKPDFKVQYRNDPKPEYIEIKGWYDPKSKTKIKRMRIYHPTVKVTLVGAKEYRAIRAKWGSAIQGWE